MKACSTYSQHFFSSCPNIATDPMVHVFIIYLLLILVGTMYRNDDDDDDSREFQNVNTAQLSL